MLLPLLGVGVLRFVQPGRRRRWLAVGVVIGTATAVGALFMTANFADCIVTSAPRGCFWDGLIAGLILVAALLLALRYAVGGDRSRYDGLLLLAAWAGIGLTPGLLLFFTGWGLFIFTVGRWTREEGLHWGFMEVRDDHREDFPEW